MGLFPSIYGKMQFSLFLKEYNWQNKSTFRHFLTKLFFLRVIIFGLEKLQIFLLNTVGHRMAFGA
jgi:hypothetical protein